MKAVETSRAYFNYSVLNGYNRPIFFTELSRRDVIPVDIRNQKLTLMPGFRLTWYYSGMEVESWPMGKSNNENSIRNEAFIRYCSNNIQVDIKVVVIKLVPQMIKVNS